MTKYDYLVTMISVTIATLKAKLSEYLRQVRRGKPVTVLHRDTPIARIVPIPAGKGRLDARRPGRKAPKLRDVSLPPPLEVEGDIVDLLLEERQVER